MDRYRSTRGQELLYGGRGEYGSTAEHPNDLETEYKWDNQATNETIGRMERECQSPATSAMATTNESTDEHSEQQSMERVDVSHSAPSSTERERPGEASRMDVYSMPSSTERERLGDVSRGGTGIPQTQQETRRQH